jgi:hypothetical protein
MRPTNNILKYSVIVFLLTLLSCNDECPEPKPDNSFDYSKVFISEIHQQNAYEIIDYLITNKTRIVSSLRVGKTEYFIVIAANKWQVVTTEKDIRIVYDMD